MDVGRRFLRATTALPLILTALGGMVGSTPAFATCVTTGSVTDCGTTSPNPYTTTVGTGRLDNDRTVTVATGAAIRVTNRNAISLGDNARITLAAGSLVRGDSTSGSGLFGTGPQPIEFNSNGILVVGAGAQVISRGTQNQAEAVNVHGFGNRIENHGLISGQASAAIWFEDQSTGAKNVVDNFGTIEQINGGTVIGTSGGSGIDFYNRTGAAVEGSLQFAAGDDDLYFFAGSTVTGSIDGGAGSNTLVLEGGLGTADTLAGALTNFQTLTKSGLGRWTITGTLTGFQSTTVDLGTLALTGDNTGYAAGVLINPLGTLEARAQSLPTQTDPAANLDTIRNNGRLRFNQPDDGTYVGQIVGSGVVEKTGAGITTLAPSAAAGNTYTGGTEIADGTLAVAADTALGAASGGLTFFGGTLRTTATFATSRPVVIGGAGGTFEPTAATTLTEDGVVGGPGRLTKIGTGTLALTATNTYAGGTQIDAGTVAVAADANLGATAGGLGMDGGTLRSTASFATSRATTLSAGGGTFETQAGTLAHVGTIAGPGGLTKTGTGTLGLDGANTYSGGTAIDAGIVAVAADANLGAAAGTLTFGGGTLRSNATMAMDRTTTMAAGVGTFAVAPGTTLTHAGAIGGPGAMAKTGSGRMILTGDATHAGGTTIGAGRLQVGDGGTSGTLGGNVVDHGVLAFDRADALDVAGIVSGSGRVVQTGPGATRLTGANTYAGTTTVEDGALYVNGDQGGATGATTAEGGTTLGGAGTIGGDVTIADGATLAPGDVGATPGTLTVNGDLLLGAGAFLDYSFGQANVAGGALNDRTVVGGGLVLDGTLDVTVSPGGSFDPGVYRVFDYAGTLTDNGLAIGTIPSPDFYVQTSVAAQVNLVNTTGLTLNFWDGEAGPKDDGVVDGGDGTWQSAAGNDNWTEATGLANAPFSDGSFAVFQGAAGTVTVDGSLGDVTVEGMQFATDGYVVRGDAIALSAAPQSIVRVGDGSAAGAGMTATIASALAGAGQLAKTDLGTLVLEGANTYAGGTAITGGVVEVAGDANLGAAAGGVALDDGTLRTTATFASARDAVLGSGGGTIETAAGTLTMTGTVSGAGALTKAGTGTLVLTGTNTYGGGTAIDGGTLVASGDATLGAAAGGLSLDGGTLSPSASFAMDRDTTLGAGGGTIAIGSGFTLAQAGDIAGAGALTKTGAGTLVLTGDGTATGGTTIAAGTLQLGDGGTTGSLAGAIVDDGVLVFDRSNAFEIAGPISGGGSVVQAGDGTTTLTGANGYAGGTAITGGTLSVAADANLGAAAGALAIDGGTLATTASFATARATTLGAGGGVIDTTAGTLGHSGTIGGAGALVKAGAGTLVLSGANAYDGATTVSGGTLVVDGDQSAATGTTMAGAGTTLAGSGTIGGDVAIADGATLAPGPVAGVPGTLAIAGDLALSGGARLAYSFGAANAIGGEFNDLTMVGGDLVLDGTLDVATTPGGSFDPGIYRVISYGGTLTDNGLAIGTIPSPQFFVQTSIANQVNLVNTTGLTLTYWDGAAGPKDDGVVNGGDGTWQTSSGNDNWTEATGAVNAPWTDAAFAIFSGAAGTVAVDASLGAVSAAGMQFTSDGYRVEGDALTLAGTEAIVRVGDGTAAGAGVTATIAAALGGASALVKADLGTLVLEGANTYTGGTVIAGGVVEIAADANLGDATGELGFDGGTLRAAADVSLARATTLDAGGGTLETGAGVTLTQAGAIVGDGALTKAGAGTVVMIGDATHTGGTTIAAGTLRIGDGGTAGSVVGDVANEGTLVFDRSDAIAFDGTVSGGGVLRQAGDGVTTLSAANTYGGGTEITGGTLSVAGDASLGAAAGPLAIDGGTLRTTAGFDTDRATTLGAGGGTIETAAGTLGHAGTIGGSGGLAKVGAGTLVLSGANAYAGSTTVAAGALFVDGDQRAAHGATTAAAGATLGGSGRLGGDVAIADGATLAPGSAGSAPGTLSVAGGLALSGGALLDYSFGAANVVGGALNDLTDVAGDLVLDGTLNVVTAAGGSFDPGVYRVIRYGGALTDNGLAIGAIPSPDFFVQTSLAGQVNLVNTAGLTLTFWDGAAGPKNDGVVDGGDGSWQSVAGNDNWTEISGEINAPWADGGFAVFGGTKGTVTIDGSLGDVTATGMQFVTDGYRLEGDAITLVGAPDAVLRVGDGTEGGAGMTATVASVLAGDSRLVKTDLGALVLSGANTYAGGTAIDGGVLEIASDANLGAAGTALSLDTGTLRVTKSLSLARATTLGAGGGTFETGTGVTLTQAADITGSGALVKTGAGTMAVTGAGSYSGGTTIAAGVLQIGDGGTAGSIAGDVANDGTLVFDRADALAFAGSVSGAGAVRQAGAGTTTLSGGNRHLGATTVAAGTLAAGRTGAFSAGSHHVVGAGGTLTLADFDQRVAGLSNAGRVSLGQVPGTRLRVAGDYLGEGGVLQFTTALGGDESATDLLTVEGDASGTGSVEVVNAGGFGGQTVNGIKLIDVAGASDARFTLVGDTVLDGRPVVVGGAYAYSLWQGGVADPGDGDWYLRSQSTLQPGPGQVQPGVPTYEGYPLTLLALNGLPTMQERVGNRYWGGAGNPAELGGMADAGGTTLPGGGLSEDGRTWMRIEGSRVTLQPDGDEIGTPEFDMDVWKLQVGMDGQLHETDDAVLIGGVTFSYGSVGTDVTSDDGNGSIDTEGYGLGGTLTWLRDDALYVDGQAQAMWYDSDLETAASGSVARGNDGFGYAAGIEAGKRIAWREDWTVTPQAQLVYASVDFDTFVDPFGVDVRGEKGAAMPLRIGVAVDQERGWKDDGGEGRRSHFYGIGNLTYDLIGETEVSVGDTGLGTEVDRLWGSLGVGGTYSWGDGAYAVYGEGLVRTSLADFGDSYANTATLGFRVAW